MHICNPRTVIVGDRTTIWKVPNQSVRNMQYGRLKRDPASKIGTPHT